MIEIDDTLEAMQAIVGGDIEEYMPFEDEVAIVCHEEGKLIGLPPNRAIYAEPETVELTYSELADRFRNAESEGKKHLTGYIVFSQESFNKPYDEKSRTYAVSSDNKAFKAGLGGYSIYGSCLDGSDPCVRLDGYMRGENAWKIEKCYLKEASREMLDIICGKFFICHAPYEAERFQSLPPDLAEKYREKFQYPERFARINDKIVAVANPFIEVGFRQVKDVVDLRVFDLLNISRINNNRAEEMLLCIYHLLQPDRRIDEGIYNDEIDQYFSYREWKKKHQPLSGVTVREILTTEDLNEVALLRIFDGVTAAFYKSDEYNSREYRYSNLSELRKAMKHKEGGTNGKAQ